MTAQPTLQRRTYCTKIFDEILERGALLQEKQRTANAELDRLVERALDLQIASLDLIYIGGEEHPPEIWLEADGERQKAVQTVRGLLKTSDFAGLACHLEECAVELGVASTH